MVVQRLVRPGPQTLAHLRSDVEEARAALAASRRLDGIERSQLRESQRHLLSTLERYISALNAAGLSPHRLVRIEVDLLRAVTTGTRGRSTEALDDQ